MLSPPGLFSITTGWPQFCDSFSANSRPPMSAPAPGPNGTMNFTVRVGQALRLRRRGERQGGSHQAARDNRQSFIGRMALPRGFVDWPERYAF